MDRSLPWIVAAALVVFGVGAAVFLLRARPGPVPRPVPTTTVRVKRPAPVPAASRPSSKPEVLTGCTAPPAEAPARVTGLVRTTDGRPTTAAVSATRLGAEAAEIEGARAGDDGRFELDLPAGAWSVQAQAPGRMSASRTVSVSVGDTADIELVLLTAATVSGLVTDPDGVAIKGAVVTAMLVEGEAEEGELAPAGSGASALSDAQGRYRMTAFPGTLNMTAEKTGFAPALGQVAVAAGSEATCDLRLVTPLRITGSVRNKAGRAIEGATVVAGWSGQGEGTFGQTYRRTATTDADGRYALLDLREGLHFLQASAPACVTEAKYQVAAGSKDVDFALPRAGRVEGKVVRKSDGSPVPSPSVSCRLASMTAWEQNTVELHVDGTFVVEGVGPGKHYVMARAKGFAPGQSEEFEVAAEQTVSDVVVALTPGGTFRGVVRAARTKAPIAGATITRLSKIGMMDIDADAFLQDPAGPTMTDAEGRFEMANVPPGKLRVKVTHDDHATLVRSLDVEEGKDAEEELLLGDAARIFGRVAGYGGRPKAGAAVFAMASNFTDQKQAQTDREGKYELKGLAAGTYMVGMNDSDAGAAGTNMSMRTVQVKEGESVEVDFTPTDGVRLYGCVRQAGRVRGNVQLQFIATSGGGTMMSAQTDVSGNYEVAGARPGEYSVVVDKAMLKCTVPKGQREARQDFDLPTGVVSGRVYDVLTRQKVEGAQVQAYRTGGAKGGMADFLERFAGSATTDAEGAYELSGLGEDEYVLQVTKEGYAVQMAEPFRMPADGSFGGVDFLLASGGKIEGVVRDGRGRPVAGATFSLRDRKTRMPVAQTELWSTRTDDDGKFSLQGIRAGEYVLGVHAEGHASGQRVVRVIPGRDATVEVVLVGAGTVRVVARNEAGAPVAGATIGLVDAEGNPVESAIGMEDLFDPSRWKTGDDGRLERPGVAPGHYRGELTKGAKRAQFEVDVEEGQTAEVSVVLR